MLNPKKVESLNSRKERFKGDLKVQINQNQEIELPKNKGILIDGLDPLKTHQITVKNESGTIWQNFKISFKDSNDPRINIVQGDFYHIDLQVNPPSSNCPWDLTH